ncbi:MAG: hypothetical protein QXZ51_05025 [Candidatus Bathyarchaeia archaeon]
MLCNIGYLLCGFNIIMATNTLYRQVGEFFTTKTGKRRKRRNTIPEDGFETIKKLLQIHCTINEVAAFFEVDIDTVTKYCHRVFGLSFKELSERYQAQGKISLRRQLWRKAIEKDDLKAQIFLAKNTLGMADRVEVKGDDGNYQFFLAYRLKDDQSDTSNSDNESKESG